MTGRKIIGIAAVAAAILISSAGPAQGQPADAVQAQEQWAAGWQQDSSEQWIYVENGRKLTVSGCHGRTARCAMSEGTAIS